MKTMLIVVAVLVVLIATIVAVGYSLPVKHRATLSRDYRTTPDSLFATIAEIDGRTMWRTGLTAVEHLPSRDGKTRFLEKGSDGNIPYVVEEVVPSKRLVTRIDDPSLPFGGTWMYEVSTTTAGRAMLRITEEGEVRNPVFRFVSRFVIGHDATMKRYLDDLGRRYPE